MWKSEEAGVCNRRVPLLMAVLIFVAVHGALCTQSVVRSTGPFRSPSGLSYMPNEVLVRMRSGATESDVASLCQKLGATSHSAMKLSNTYRITLPDVTGKVAVDELIGQVKADSRVVWAERNGICHMCAVPNDPLYTASTDPLNSFFFDGQWALQPGFDLGVRRDHVFAQQGWDLEKGQDSVIVAVLDTGLRTEPLLASDGSIRRYPHPDLGMYRRVTTSDGRLGYTFDINPDGTLNDRLIFGTSMFDDRNKGFLDPSPSEVDGDWIAGAPEHGTHVSGIIAAKTDNGAGVASLCWNKVWLFPIRICKDGNASASDDATIADAILYCCSVKFTNSDGNKQAINAINISFGGPTVSSVLQAAIAEATRLGIVVVAAAGNDWDLGPFPPSYPGGYEDSICVSATNIHDLITPWSQRGRAVDIAAPGNDILSTIYIKPSDKAIDDYNKKPPLEDLGADPIDPSGDIDIWGNGYETMSGTSMATPMVTAAVALLLSHTVPGSDVRDILRQTATPIGVGHPNDAYGWGLLNVYAALKKASIDVKINTPSNGGTVQTKKPKFRIDFRNADPSTIRVWIDPVDADQDGVPDGTPIISGTDSDFNSKYFVLDSKAGKSYLLFDNEFTVPGIHKVQAMAATKLLFDVPPAVPLTSTDTVQFKVDPQTLAAGWHLFAMPFKVDDGIAPGDLLPVNGVLARWNYTTSVTGWSASTRQVFVNRTGQYAMYSLDGSHSDNEASLRPASALNSDGRETEPLVHSLSNTAAGTPPAGLGYWLFLSRAVDLPDISGQPVDSEPYVIGLYKGWNMIGNPFPFAVDWSTVTVEYAGDRYSISDAVSKGWISNFIFRYDNPTARYSWKQIGQAIMPAWEGEWIQVRTSGPPFYADNPNILFPPYIDDPDIKLIIPPSPYTGAAK